ncbi:MAG TPA: aldo/keto reductase [Micromonosporaceae bacterium]|nr:aldo/keto reductase [Micromonosporaceae bacterium]
MTIEVTAFNAGTVRLGDLEVPRLGFGAMRLPGPGVWGPPVDRDEAIRTVRRAVELGVRVIDSAWYYGRDVANEVIAAAIRPYPDDLVLVTKLGGARTDDGGWFNGITPDGLRAGCERDLRVLGVETVPVVHLRWMDGAPITFDEALDVMVELRTEGKIGRIGLSNVTADQLTNALSRAPIVSVSNLFGPAEQGDAATVDLCAAHGIAYLPFFPLAAGRVATAADDALRAVAAKHDCTNAQVAIAWLLRRSPTMLPIPGTSKVAHLEENVAAGALRLDDDDMAALAAALA